FRKLNQVLRGWINYFRIGSMKQWLKNDFSPWLRHKVRVVRKMRRLFVQVQIPVDNTPAKDITVSDDIVFKLRFRKFHLAFRTRP
ncbi:MAG: hypothetical protein IKD68_01735, partial [Solobacterium sp.]|nr:hypothetical protein [Solobacterium sp.]